MINRLDDSEIGNGSAPLGNDGNPLIGGGGGGGGSAPVGGADGSECDPILPDADRESIIESAEADRTTDGGTGGRKGRSLEGGGMEGGPFVLFRFDIELRAASGTGNDLIDARLYVDADPLITPGSKSSIGFDVGFEAWAKALLGRFCLAGGEGNDP